MTRGFRQFQILPQEVSRVESKIELSTENKTVFVIYTKVYFLELDICVDHV